MTDNLEVMVARIDERMGSIQSDVGELKNSSMALTKAVNEHSTQLAIITEQIKASNHGLSRRQAAGIGGGAGFVTAIIAAIIEYFRH